MRIQHSLPAMTAARISMRNQTCLAKNLEKLSSGLAINRSADDAAGLGISESMRAKLWRLDQAKQNVLDGIGLIQTADGALTEMHSMLQVMNRLSLQCMTGTLTDTQRGMLEEEYQQLVEEMDRIAKETNFNGIHMLDGSVSEVEGALLVEESEETPKEEAGPVREMPSGPAVSISGTNFTIRSGGVYTIEDSFTGKITIEGSGQNVLLKSTSGNTLTNVSIDCAKETNLYIENLHIKNDISSLNDNPIINFKGTGNSLNLVGDNGLTANITYRANTASLIHVGEGTELTVYEAGIGGTLSVGCVGGEDNGSDFDRARTLQGALIGGGKDETCGKIHIVDGTLSLNTEFIRGAGIGSGFQGRGGDILIEGGKIDVKLWGEGAGIGGGSLSDGGNIMVTGGEINVKNIRATKEEVLGAGIGGGRTGSGGNIEISGGRIIIDHNPYQFQSNDYGGHGAGIGGGGAVGGRAHGVTDDKAGDGGSIHITGGEIELRTKYGAGIGGGGCYTGGRCNAGDGGEITIDGGTIKINVTHGGAGIGSGACASASGNGGATGTILIRGGDIDIQHSFGAGIGAAHVRGTLYGSDQSSSSITILGGDVRTTGNRECAGIGAINKGNSAAIVIDNVHSGGSVTVSTISSAPYLPVNAIGDGFVNDDANPTKVKVAKGSKVDVLNGMTWKREYFPPGTLADNLLGEGSLSKPERGLIIQLSERPEKIYIYIENMRAHSLGLTKTRIDSYGASVKAHKRVNNAIELVSGCRGRLGACQNRLEHTLNNIEVGSENIQAAESRIRDTDIAKEFTTYSKNSILLHASQAMLTQANLAPQEVLNLLR